MSDEALCHLFRAKLMQIFLFSYAALHVVTLGLSSETEKIFQQALAAMEPVIAKGAKVPDVAVSAIEALSMMCFVAAEGPDETVEVMDLLQKAFTAGKCPPSAPARPARTPSFLPAFQPLTRPSFAMQAILMSNQLLLGAGPCS